MSMPSPDSQPQADPRRRFHGRYRLKLDEKGRVSLPAIFRRAIPTDGDTQNGTLILMQGPAGYLQARSVQEWDQRVAQLAENAELKGQAGRWRRRKLFAGVVPAPIDHKGRFQISRELREAGGLGDEVIILGVDRALEIWDPNRYFELDQQQKIDLSDVEDILF